MVAGRKKCLNARKPDDDGSIYRIRKPHKSHKACNLDEIYEMAKHGQTDVAIAKYQGISVDTLNNHFSEILTRGRIDGDNGLLKAQYETAVGGNPTLLIHLGKCRLKQKDEDVENTNQSLANKLFETWQEDAKAVKAKKT